MKGSREDILLGRGYNRRKLGGEKEQQAGRYLEEQGYRILEYNFRGRDCEIDIVARDCEYLVFVEVKYRSDETYGVPAEAVDYGKQRRISKAALYYLCRKQLPEDTPCRFDVVAVGKNGVLEVVKDAFEYVQ